ncbi:MAG: LLM class oxidoreductase [Planctomycetota bacterium]
MTEHATATTPEPQQDKFGPINRGYDAVFQRGRLSVGLVVPITAYPVARLPDMAGQVQKIQQAEALGFSAVWLRDVPFDVPSFGDAGQVYDPFVYLGLLAGQTRTIALGVASLILPLRHPAHVAKAAASVDVLSGGRLILGIASGDRPDEYPALGIPFHERGQRFRESFDYIRHMSPTAAAFENGFGRSPGGIDLLPKPTAESLPMLVTGGSQQDPAWIAEHADGWIVYPREPLSQRTLVHEWRGRVEDAGRSPKPVMQPLYIDLADDSDTPPTPIHLGMRLGMKRLIDYVQTLETAGINHLALNLRFNRADIGATLQRLSEELLPHFTDPTTRNTETPR